MLLSRTRQTIIHRFKECIFDKGGFQKIIDVRDKHQLEDAMGFRGQFDEHRRFQIALLKEQGLAPCHRLLEIGCGPLTGGLPIIEFLGPGNYVGIDVRDRVLDMSWKEIGRQRLSQKNPQLICSTSFGSAELGNQQFDFILSFSVLYHLSDDLLASYFGEVRKRLKPTGVCLANVNTLYENSRWLEFPFLKRTIEEYYEVAGSHGLAGMFLGELRQLGFRLSSAECHNALLSFRIK